MNILEEIKIVKKRNRILKQLEDFALDKGLIKVESDMIEEYRSYMDQNPIQKGRKLVKVQDMRGNLFVLRPDITTNIIGKVIPRLPEGSILDCYYLDYIFGIDSNGFFSKNRQFGIELIGNRKDDFDINMIEYVQEIFEQYNVDLYLEIGNQKIVTIILEKMNVSNREYKVIMELLYKKNRDDLKKQLIEKETSAYKTLLLNLLNPEKSLEEITNYTIEKDLSRELVNELLKLKNVKDSLSASNISFDLSLVQDFDYYNGFIFRGYIDNYKTDIVRGGRYDLITKEYGNQTEALGFSLDVDVLIKEVITNE